MISVYPALALNQVTVAVVRYESLQRQRIGVTSTYLAERLAVRLRITRHTSGSLQHHCVQRGACLCDDTVRGVPCRMLACSDAPSQHKQIATTRINA